MKYILALLSSTLSYGQLLVKHPYQDKMDSIAISKLNLSISLTSQPERLIRYNPFHNVRITIKTGFNKSLVQNIYSSIRSDSTLSISQVVDEFLNELEVDDYVNLVRYSIRCKVYIRKRLKWVTNIVGSGIDVEGYSISTGFIFKY